MTKRAALSPHDGDLARPAKKHFTNDLSQASTSVKSVATASEALSILGEYTEELTDSLRYLKQARNQVFARNQSDATLSVQKRLSRISKAIIPSLQFLADINDEDEDIYYSCESVSGGASIRVQANNLQSSIPKSTETEVSLKDADTPQPSAENADAKSNGVPIFPLAWCTAWIASEISPGLPPLPKILDPEMERVVFTHPGIDAASNYQRLEWLGDAYIETIASGFIYETFGEKSTKRYSQMREQLVRNITLAQYFRQYGLTSRARLPADLGSRKELGRGSSKDHDLMKTQSDMFEAYVAAVIISDPKSGLANTIAWLKALWGTSLEEQIKQVERIEAANTTRQAEGYTTANGFFWKEKLAQAIGAKGIFIRYKDMPGSGEKKEKRLNLTWFTVGVYLDGWGEKDKLLGIGSGQSKKDAGQKAAENALQNKKQIKVYIEKKRAFEEAQKAVLDESGF
ncbi:hypothetical protein S40285_03069 [Stachybotrys chlorohalonatus IBT 40285]|uniref:RNase III domain-containing protein n=1 Tax=Stachybotrys chlorohalonatus (strain IBT 40285) TaxID=1283841 RepID=A0A084QRR0_STAC4|nr:hypothetical protein S40285_03069 [Stachybotrys chlorohalonata IBT 40285]